MIIVKLNNNVTIEKALKLYKSKVIKTRQMRKINDKKEYEKPSVKNRIIKEKAKYIEQKKRSIIYRPLFITINKTIKCRQLHTIYKIFIPFY